MLMSQAEMDAWVDFIWDDRLATLTSAIESTIQAWEQDQLDDRDLYAMDGTWQHMRDSFRLYQDLSAHVRTVMGQRRVRLETHVSPEIFNRYYRRYAEKWAQRNAAYVPGRGIVFMMG
jgi:hypothetical protein